MIQPMDDAPGWSIDPDEYLVLPPDGGEPICYWWEDMRPREVWDRIIEAYERGRGQRGPTARP